MVVDGVATVVLGKENVGDDALPVLLLIVGAGQRDMHVWRVSGVSRQHTWCFAHSIAAWLPFGV